MKKHKDLLLTLLAIAVIAGLIFAVKWSKRSELPTIDLSKQKAKSEEHQLVGEILKDTEAFVVAEDAALLEKTPSTSHSPLPALGASLPAAWDSQPAPSIDEVELSPSLQRSLAASASLRTEEYINPSSDLNLERVGELRQIRQTRHSE
jgi:hypothetical protein